METVIGGLLLKIVMTASIVVAASVVVERSGPFIGSLIASLPTAGGAALIILAMEHPPDFVAASAVGSIVSNAICAAFALSYAALAQRQSLLTSLSGAYALWFAAAYASSFIEWTAVRALLLTAVVFPLTIVAGRPFRAVSTGGRAVRLSFGDLAWRVGVVTLCVIVVTSASYSIGSFASGVFVYFPVALGSYFVILHPRIGGPAAASVAAHVQLPLVGLVLSMLAVHLTADRIGVWWSYGLGLSIGIAWNAMLWAIRNLRSRGRLV
ncbi:MAG: hypothetical protein ACK4UO_02815 [Pseudolabrys sp.]